MIESSRQFALEAFIIHEWVPLTWQPSITDIIISGKKVTFNLTYYFTVEKEVLPYLEHPLRLVSRCKTSTVFELKKAIAFEENCTYNEFYNDEDVVVTKTIEVVGKL